MGRGIPVRFSAGMDARKLVGENLKKAREAAGLSQVELAHRLGATSLGIQQSYLSELERGKRNPTLLTLAAIADALQIRLHDLFIEGQKARASEPGTPSSGTRT